MPQAIQTFEPMSIFEKDLKYDMVCPKYLSKIIFKIRFYHPSFLRFVDRGRAMPIALDIHAMTKENSSL